MEDLPLLGRDGQLQALLAAYAQARSGSGRLLVLRAQPGAGLRRLLREFRAELGRRHLDHVWLATRGRDASDPPLGALVPLLRGPGQSLAGLLGGLTGFPPEVRAVAIGEGLARLLAGREGPRPIVVVVERAERLDPASADALRVALPALVVGPTLALVTVPAAGMGWAGDAELELGPLSAEQATELALRAGAAAGTLGARTGTQPGHHPGGPEATDRAVAIAELSGGLPGLVVELARTADPTRPAAARLAATIPGGMEVLAGAWLADGWLADWDLEQAVSAVAGTTAGLAAMGALVRVADRPGPTCGHPAWWEVARAGLGPGGLRTVAGQLASGDLGALPLPVRAGLLGAAGHADAARTWLAAADEAGPNVEAEAAYLSRAYGLLPASDQPVLAARVADRALAVGQYQWAREVVAQALAQLPRDAAGQRCRLLVLGHRARFQLGETAAADAELDEALALAARSSDPAAASDAFCLDALRWVSRDPVLARQQAERAIRAAGDDVLRAGAARGVLALAVGLSGDVDQALELFDAAIAATAGDRAAEGRVAANRLYLLWRAGRMAELGRASQIELDRLRRWGLADTIGGQVLIARALSLQVTGQWDELADYLATLPRDRLAAEVLVFLDLIAAELAADRGAHQRAAELLARVHDNAARTGPEVAYEVLAVRLETLARRPDASARDLRPLVAEATDLLAGLSDRYAATRVRVALARAGEGVAARADELPEPGPGSPAPIAQPDDSAIHRALLAEESAWRGQGSWVGAAAAWRSLPDPYHEAWCLLRAARELGGDQALGVVAEVVAVADRLGAAPLAARAALASRNLGIRAGRGAGPLTARELDVLRLVAQGRTNREVARELALSERTVAVHLSRIFTKLDAGTRGEAVAKARDQGLIAGNG